MIEPTPTLPFADYKWKWASLQPTESLNRPEYFVGVLRALASNQGRRKSDPRFTADLRRIEKEIDFAKGPSLARGANERNIIRNAGQYWKVLGVLGPELPITLTPLGKLYAARDISLQEFAVHTVLNLRLPSSVYRPEEVAEWKAAGISFRPLLLILQIVAALADIPGTDLYISESELADIVQPLSATTTDPSRIAMAIAYHRAGLLDISSWPTTVSKSNDRRVSAEFLLFLASHNLLREVESPPSNQKYKLAFALPDDILELADIDPARLLGDIGIEEVAAEISVRVERRRVSREVYDRPGQKKFRDDVLDISQQRCLLTGTQLPAVLQAAHIRPVASDGSDLVGNGLCLRSDVHTLFDSNRIRIRPDGEMSYSGEVLRDPSYSDLPGNVILPQHVNKAEVHWRWSFV
ncbi:HNH endonuclease [Arthrobacter sp. EPSL27]|uniref:HNH endonuclease n=1 Tax=Arthrobacter sp. EPSL27 TaxID=1745378 RepID=UPI0009E9B006|nr:HNH endonuclease signature motif containing protein [Arthrobacter sp. EPSL27]